MKKTVIRGVNALTRVHTPNYGGSLLRFPKNLRLDSRLILTIIIANRRAKSNKGDDRGK